MTYGFDMTSKQYQKSIRHIVSLLVGFFVVGSAIGQPIQTRMDVVPTTLDSSTLTSEVDQRGAGWDTMIDTTDFVDMSLEEVVELAIQHNRQLKIYRLLGDDANIRLEQAEYQFLPNAYVNAARNESRNDDLGYVIKKESYNSSIGFSRALETGGDVRVSVNSSKSESSQNPGVTNYNTNVGIQVDHPLMRGMGIDINLWPIERAKNKANISLINVKRRMINLITTIESRYWDLILVFEDQKIQNQALERARQLLEVNKSLIESGRMAAQEIVQAESDIATREIEVAKAENDIISTQISLQSQLDLPERIWIDPSTEMEFTPVDIHLDECLERAFLNRPDWLINQYWLSIREMDLVVARNDNRYELNSTARVSSDANSTQTFQSAFLDAFGFSQIAWNVGFSFTIPFNKKVLENGYLLKKLELERQQLEVEELRDNIRIQVENAVRRVHFTLRQVHLARTAKTLTEQKLALEEEKMRVGRSTNFQVISYQRDLINAQNAELQAIANYLKALGQLQKTMGTTLEQWGIDFQSMK